MPIASNSGGEQIAPVPAGSALGICYGCIDIGTQPQHGAFLPKREVMLLFELPHLRADFTVDGQPKNLARVVNKRWTLSLAKKANLRRDLIAWRGRDFTAEEEKRFEVANVVGAMALVSITHKKLADGSRTYANVTGLMKPLAGTDKMKPENKIIVFDIPKDGPIVLPEGMPEWIQNLIKQLDEYIQSINPNKAPAKGPTERQMANLTDEVIEEPPF